MNIRPCAKINLGLNIVEKRADGYHNLETVFYPVPLYDEITIEESTESAASTCLLTLSGQQIEGDPEKNLVVRAYRLLEHRYSLPPIHIHLTKSIPMQAGMGGGSADGTYTLRLLNEMFSLGISNADMERYAATLGADCAFFVKATPSYAKGIGEQLSPIDLSLKDYYLAIVKPPIAVSTREAFSLIKPQRPEKNCRNIVSQPIETWREELRNDFEESIFPQYPRIGEIKEQLYHQGALYAAMSGSGSALFALFREQPDHLSTLFPDCFTAIKKLEK
jgi:4-diphosphocytidyl-2-C-methyl-D-erythritol kinase